MPFGESSKYTKGVECRRSQKSATIDSNMSKDLPKLYLNMIIGDFESPDMYLVQLNL